MYRKPLEFLHKSAHGAKQNSGDYFSLPLMGKSQENMSVIFSVIFYPKIKSKKTKIWHILYATTL